MKTPPVTTIRVNLLRSSINTVKDRVREVFRQKYGSEEELKFIERPDDHPDLLGIASLQRTSQSPPEDITKEVIVDSNCGRSVLRGANIFAPGVLGMSKHCADGDRVKVYADIEGLCKKGSFEFPSERKYYLGIGKILQMRFKLFGQSINPSGVAVEMLTTITQVPSIGDGYLNDFHGILQNFPSLIAVRCALAPRRGERVLDMCSAPGHKTSQIVEMMEDEGAIFALEKVKKKVEEMQRKMTELNYKSLKCFAMDAGKCVAGEGVDGKWDEPPFVAETFDRVLLDAPCSGLGNRPQLAGSNKITLKMLKSYPQVQKQLFYAAVAALKKGGTLVYSTCTINQSENEAIVAWALQKFECLKLTRIETEMGGEGWKTTGLTEEDVKMVKRFGPPTERDENGLNNSIGFFIAKFMKHN